MLAQGQPSAAPRRGPPLGWAGPGGRAGQARGSARLGLGLGLGLGTARPRPASPGPMPVERPRRHAAGS